MKIKLEITLSQDLARAYRAWFDNGGEMTPNNTIALTPEDEMSEGVKANLVEFFQTFITIDNDYSTYLNENISVQTII